MSFEDRARDAVRRVFAVEADMYEDVMASVLGLRRPPGLSNADWESMRRAWMEVILPRFRGHRESPP